MEEKDEDLIRKFINGGFPGQGRHGVDTIHAYSSAVYAIKQLQDEIDRYSTPPSHSFDDMIDDDDISNKVLNQIDDDLNNTVLTKDVIDGLIAKINANGNNITYPTPPKDDTYKLTKERGYFIYWLMMHFAFLEDKGFNSQYPDISNNIPAWGRSVITDGKYTEYDRAFLKEVTEWLPNSEWAYRKPILNEYND
jgi:hypothetical protein